MKIDNVMAVTEHMMAYLIGKEEKLSIVTDVDGEHQDFFNEQDRLHLADVRKLFLGGLKLRNYAVILATILMIVLRAKKGRFPKTGSARIFAGAVCLSYFGGNSGSCHEH